MTPSLKKDMRIYAHSLDFLEDDLCNKESFFSNDDFLRSSLINEELSGPVSFCYGKSVISIRYRGEIFFYANALRAENVAINCL